MMRTQGNRGTAQSFDQIAADYDRLGDLNNGGHIAEWLVRQLPDAGRRALDRGCGTGRHAALLATRFEHVDGVDVSGPMVDIARARRARPNITYQQADLHDVSGAGRYDLIVSLMALHHVPDLRAALSHVRSLLAPGGRVVLADAYSVEPDRLSARWILMEAPGSLLPLRARLHVMAVLRLGRNLPVRGPAAAWETYRLTVRRAWLDHIVSDRFFSRSELELCCADLMPGARLDILGGPRGIGLVWDAPR
jgi:SAM-dependent methyltransferase